MTTRLLLLAFALGIVLAAAPDAAAQQPTPAAPAAQGSKDKLGEWPALKDTEKERVLALAGQFRKQDEQLQNDAKQQLIALGDAAMPLLMQQTSDRADNTNAQLFAVFDTVLGPRHAALMARETKKPRVELRRYLTRRMCSFADRDLAPVCDTLTEELMTGLFELFGEHIAPVRLRHSNLSYRRLVSGAREYVLSQPDRVISVTDLCEALHVSRRTLQNAFRAVLGICPVNYLKALRLNAVRRTLRDHDSGFRTVQDVAARWGFWHMSQFAADYFAMFAEHPSDTLKAGGGEHVCFRYPSSIRARAERVPLVMLA